MSRKRDFNKLIKELKDSKTEEEILDYLIKLVKAFNLSEYNDVFQSNPYYKSLIPDIKPVVINDISKIRKDIVNEIEKIDKEAGLLIKYIDDIKIEIMEKSNEDVKTVRNEDEKVIVWRKYNPKFPLLPTRLNLIACLLYTSDAADE